MTACIIQLEMTQEEKYLQYVTVTELA